MASFSFQLVFEPLFQSWCQVSTPMPPDQWLRACLKLNKVTRLEIAVILLESIIVEAFPRFKVRVGITKLEGLILNCINRVCCALFSTEDLYNDILKACDSSTRLSTGPPLLLDFTGLTHVDLGDSRRLVYLSPSPNRYMPLKEVDVRCQAYHIGVITLKRNHRLVSLPPPSSSYAKQAYSECCINITYSNDLSTLVFP